MRDIFFQFIYLFFKKSLKMKKGTDYNKFHHVNYKLNNSTTTNYL